ncbi:hypothetical protein MASR1M66_22440 [Aminivibrio sp.]
MNANFNFGKELSQTFIIAEIGANHNRSLSLAKEHIDAAADGGADAVKFRFTVRKNSIRKRPPPFWI